MAKAGFKMREVVGWFAYRPYPDDERPDYRRVSWPKDVLECGHVLKMPTISSTVDALKAAFEAMGFNDKPPRRRCYKCGSGEPPAPAMPREYRGWTNEERDRVRALIRKTKAKAIDNATRS